MPANKTTIAATLNEIDERRSRNESLLNGLPLFDVMSSSQGAMGLPNTGFVEISATVEPWLTHFPGSRGTIATCSLPRAEAANV
jgi:hypothetical protein